MKISENSEFSILPCTKIENSDILEVCLFFQILTIVITQDLKTTKIWTKQKTPIWIKRKKKNFRDFQVFNFDLHPTLKTRKSRKFCLLRILTLVVIQDLKTPKKWAEAKTKTFRYDLEQKRKFPRFPSFQFCPIPKTENSEI